MTSQQYDPECFWPQGAAFPPVAPYLGAMFGRAEVLARIDAAFQACTEESPDPCGVVFDTIEELMKSGPSGKVGDGAGVGGCERKGACGCGGSGGADRATAMAVEDPCLVYTRLLSSGVPCDRAWQVAYEAGQERPPREQDRGLLYGSLISRGVMPDVAWEFAAPREGKAGSGRQTISRDASLDDPSMLAPGESADRWDPTGIQGGKAVPTIDSGDENTVHAGHSEFHASGTSYTFNYGDLSFSVDWDWLSSYLFNPARWTPAEKVLEELWPAYRAAFRARAGNWKAIHDLLVCYNVGTTAIDDIDIPLYKLYPNRYLFWNEGWGAPHRLYLNMCGLVLAYADFIDLDHPDRDSIDSDTSWCSGFAFFVAELLRGRSAKTSPKNKDDQRECFLQIYFRSQDPEFEDDRFVLSCDRLNVQAKALPPSGHRTGPDPFPEDDRSYDPSSWVEEEPFSGYGRRSAMVLPKGQERGSLRTPTCASQGLPSVAPMSMTPSARSCESVLQEPSLDGLSMPKYRCSCADTAHEGEFSCGWAFNVHNNDPCGNPWNDFIITLTEDGSITTNDSEDPGIYPYTGCEDEDGDLLLAIGGDYGLTMHPIRLAFDGHRCDYLLYHARMAMQYAKDNFRSHTDEYRRYMHHADRIARYVLRIVARWSRLLIHELGHTYCGKDHCGTGDYRYNNCFEVASYHWLCKVEAELGLPHEVNSIVAVPSSAKWGPTFVGEDDGKDSWVNCNVWAAETPGMGKAARFSASACRGDVTKYEATDPYHDCDWSDFGDHW